MLNQIALAKNITAGKMVTGMCSIQGQIAQAALAWASGLACLKADHSSLTPSLLEITLQNK